MRSIKSIFVVLFCAANMMLMSGCETTKGVAVGVGATAIGVGKDAKTAWKGIEAADAWVKKNLW